MDKRMKVTSTPIIREREVTITMTASEAAELMGTLDAVDWQSIANILEYPTDEETVGYKLFTALEANKIYAIQDLSIDDRLKLTKDYS